jgi:hypothetical protein
MITNKFYYILLSVVLIVGTYFSVYPDKIGSILNKANAFLYSTDSGYGPAAAVTVTPLGGNDFSIQVTPGHLDMGFNCVYNGGTGYATGSSSDVMATGEFGVFLDPVMYETTSGHVQGGTSINSEDFPTSPGPQNLACPVGTHGSGSITDADSYTTTFHLPAGQTSFDIGYYIYHTEEEGVPPDEVYYTNYFQFEQLYHYGTGTSGAYSLTVIPVPDQIPPTGPVNVMRGNNKVYTVTAACTGGATGPISNLVATSAFTNLNYAFSNNSVNCGSSVTLTVSNTNAIGLTQFSTPQSRLPQTITVTGSAD